MDIEARIIEAQHTQRSLASNPTAANNAVLSGPSFADVLGTQVKSPALFGVKFSAHAQTRLLSRNIHLSEADLAKISSAITKAASKGARESLVLTDKAALVISIPNRTVITAVDPTSLKDNIFTNIDSAVII